MKREIEITCTFAPVQIEGQLGEYPFYFRARHKDASFNLSLPGGDPVLNSDGSVIVAAGVSSFLGVGGPHFASNLNVDTARRFVDVCLDMCEQMISQHPPQPK